MKPRAAAPRGAHRSPDLFTAVEVAGFCAVDLKTIHHWAARGKLPHHMTQGRHMRVWRADLVAFLRAYAMPLPRALRNGRPRVVVADATPRGQLATKRAFGKRFAVEMCADLVDALVALGREPAQALAIVAAPRVTDLAHVRARLAAREETRHVHVVSVGDGSAGHAESATDEARAELATRLAELLGVG